LPAALVIGCTATVDPAPTGASADPVARSGAALTTAPSSASQTVVLQPGADEGKDATVNTWAPTNNYGSSPDLTAIAWTFSGTPVTFRSYLQFNLGTIPRNAVIGKATLTLYGDPALASSSQSSALSGPNTAVLSRVTADWNEATITWTNQPSTTTDGQITIPLNASGPANVEVDVTALLQQSLPFGSNHGFELALADEQAYRRLAFASSDNPNPTLRPKLEVAYIVPDAAARVAADSEFDIYYLSPSGEPQQDTVDVACAGWQSEFSYKIPSRDIELSSPDEYDYNYDIEYDVTLYRNDVFVTEFRDNPGACVANWNDEDPPKVESYSCLPVTGLFDMVPTQDGTYSATTLISYRGTVMDTIESGKIDFTAHVGHNACLPGATLDSKGCHVATAPKGTKPVVTNGKLYTTSAPSCPLAGSWYDGANCYVSWVPAGTTPFAYNNALYYTPQPTCPLAGSWFDGANCYVSWVPAGTKAFAYNNSLYYTPGPGNTCPLAGSWFDGANCYVTWVPQGTHAFVYNNQLYYTPVPSHNCPLSGSWYDGANCYVTSVPSGTQAFAYGNALYYTPAPSTNCLLPGSTFDGTNCYVATVPSGSTGFVSGSDLYYSPVCQ
jgi:hypothetical protein